MTPTSLRVAWTRASGWARGPDGLRSALLVMVRPGAAAPRLVAGAALGLAATLLATLGGGAPGAPRPTAAAAFAGGAAFGPGSVIAFAGVEAATGLALGLGPLEALLTAFADALLGAVAFLTFRDLRGVGRGIHDLASYLALLAAALVGSLVTGLFLAWLGFADRLLHGLGLYAVGNVTSVVLGGLPLLMALDHWLRPWMEPLPEETRAPPLERLTDETLDPQAPAEDVEATVVVTRPRVASWELAGGAVLILAVTLLAAPLIVADPAGGAWVAVLYLLPVIGAAQHYGLRGGLLAASLSGLAYLAAAGFAGLRAGDLAAPGELPLALYAQLLLLSPVGAFLGQAREREHRLRRELTQHHRLLRQDLLRVVQALTSAVEAKDSYTEAHLRRVAEYAVAVGRRLGVHGRQLENVYYAAMLHDIGKIAVPEAVLRKPDTLSAEEVDVMREHPVVGARIVAGLDLLRDAAPLIRHHQERWDGGGEHTYPGYPDGLVGEAIPLGARIIAVVDAFDAMTTDRPYRRGRTIVAAMAELEAESGRQFDPRVIRAFLAVLAERPWT
jgi:hypothetical protein